MITKFITEVNAKFNPFSVSAKPARLFLTYLPPNARMSGMTINTKLLPRNSTEPNSLNVKFSMLKSILFFQ
jgi:large subunit ribosomal protein L53